MGRLTGLGITSSALISSSRQRRKQDEGSALESSAIKRSKLDDNQIVAANADLDMKEHKLDNSNVHSIEKPETDSLAGWQVGRVRRTATAHIAA
jgi:hypothetical protein